MPLFGQICWASTTLWRTSPERPLRLPVRELIPYNVPEYLAVKRPTPVELRIFFGVEYCLWLDVCSHTQYDAAMA